MVHSRTDPMVNTRWSSCSSLPHLFRSWSLWEAGAVRRRSWRSFFDQAGEITFSESLKIDRLISIVLETENFADRPNLTSKSKAENSDGTFWRCL